MGLADFKSVGGDFVAAGGSIPSPSAIEKTQPGRKGGAQMAEKPINLMSMSEYSG